MYLNPIAIVLYEDEFELWTDTFWLISGLIFCSSKFP